MHNVLLLQGLSREKYRSACVVMERWRVAKLTVTDKLKINDLMSSMDGPLLRYMYLFRII